MRTIGTLLLAVLLSLGFAVTSFAAIKGSPHDLSYLSTTGKGNQICSYCHTPHFKGETLTYPLWSATVQTSTTFAEYVSPTLDGVIVDPLVGPSRLCMSCHDGSIAIDSALSGNTLIATDFRIGEGSDLSSDHPIGFDYTLVAGEISGLDAEIYEESTGYANGFISDYLFEGNMMTCSSCHDVHEENGDGGKFLLVGNAGSALCLSCHIK